MALKNPPSLPESSQCGLILNDLVKKIAHLPEEDREGIMQDIERLGVCLDQTEHALHEVEALRESERIYRAISEAIDYGVWICEPDGRNRYASQSFLDLLGITQRQCSDFGWGSSLHPEDVARTLAAWKDCVRTGGAWDIEHRFLGKDGQYHPILSRGVPVRNERGEIICWAGINLDISRLKQAEEEFRINNEALRKSEGFQRALNEINQAIHSTLDIGEILHRSLSAAARALGCDTAAISLRKGDRWILSGVHGLSEDLLGLEMDDSQELHAVLAIQTKMPVAVNDAFHDPRFNREHLRKWGIRAVLVMPIVVKDEATGVMFFNYHQESCTFNQAQIDFVSQLAASLSLSIENSRLFNDLQQEIAERKRMEQALALSERKYRELVQYAPTAIYEIDFPTARFTSVNDAMVTMTGYTRAELLQMNPFDLLDEQSQDLFKERTRQWQSGVQPDKNVEYLVKTKDGRMIYALLDTTFITDEHGRPLSASVIAHDITERKRVEDALRQSEATLRESEAAQRRSAANERARANELEAVMDAAPAIIWISRDPECREMIGNRYSYDFLHIRQGENVSKTAPEEDLTVQEYRMEKDGCPIPASELPMQIAAATGKPAQDYTFDLVYQNGTVFHMFGNVNPLFDADGKPYGAIGVFVDLTNLRQLEAEQIMAKAEIEVQRRLMDQREQERMVIARDLHDGPIQTLSSSTFHLQVIKQAFPDAALQVELNQIGMDIKNSIHEIRQVLNDLRPPALMHFGFTRMIQIYTEDLRERFPDIEIEMDVTDDNKILSEEARLALFRIYQAGINNIVRHSGASHAWVVFKLDPDSFRLELRDNGRGFEMNDDFTHLTREGHFGLAGMKERTEAIGGSFRVASEPGYGTTVVVKGPLSGKNLK